VLVVADRRHRHFDSHSGSAPRPSGGPSEGLAAASGEGLQSPGGCARRSCAPGPRHGWIRCRARRQGPRVARPLPRRRSGDRPFAAADRPGVMRARSGTVPDRHGPGRDVGTSLTSGLSGATTRVGLPADSSCRPISASAMFSPRRLTKAVDRLLGPGRRTARAQEAIRLSRAGTVGLGIRLAWRSD
jgi:hypothetical protein